MPDDIVTRLRERNAGGGETRRLLTEAADEIERLRKVSEDWQMCYLDAFKLFDGAVDHAKQLRAFYKDAVAVVRAYRGRIHRADEDVDGTLSEWHTVFGVPYALIAAADKVRADAETLGLLEGTLRDYTI